MTVPAETCQHREWCWKLYTGRKRRAPEIPICGYEKRGGCRDCMRFQDREYWLKQEAEPCQS